MATNGTGKLDKAAKRQKFLDVFPVLAEELVGYVKSTGSPEEVWGWFERVRLVCCSPWDMID
jgi:farnesyl diphosphate synthase